jgi:hypothetical protein
VLLLLDLGLGAFERFAKIADATAEGATNFGELTRSENEQGHDQYDDELGYT